MSLNDILGGLQGKTKEEIEGLVRDRFGDQAEGMLAQFLGDGKDDQDADSDQDSATAQDDDSQDDQEGSDDSDDSEGNGSDDDDDDDDKKR